MVFPARHNEALLELKVEHNELWQALKGYRIGDRAHEPSGGLARKETVDGVLGALRDVPSDSARHEVAALAARGLATGQLLPSHAVQLIHQLGGTLTRAHDAFPARAPRLAAAFSRGFERGDFKLRHVSAVLPAVEALIARDPPYEPWHFVDAVRVAVRSARLTRFEHIALVSRHVERAARLAPPADPLLPQDPLLMLDMAVDRRLSKKVGGMDKFLSLQHRLLQRGRFPPWSQIKALRAAHVATSRNPPKGKR